MKYTEAALYPSPDSELAQEILIALLAERGYDSFAGEAGCLKGYIPTSDFSRQTLEALLADFPLAGVQIRYECTEMEDIDWNEEWEKNFFRPIVIGERCVIHSSFHTDIPAAEYDILINPKMAFGTGHHETTSLILEELLDADLQGKRVLDMGCGTSILAILAALRGAAPVVAIDIDDWCVDNSKENIALNGMAQIEVLQGDASSLSAFDPFDVVIANINRNILLRDMEAYVRVMHLGAHLWMSGFYTEDIPMLREKAESIGLQFLSQREKRNWAAIHLSRLK